MDNDKENPQAGGSVPEAQVAPEDEADYWTEDGSFSSDDPVGPGGGCDRVHTRIRGAAASCWLRGVAILQVR